MSEVEPSPDLDLEALAEVAETAALAGGDVVTAFFDDPPNPRQKAPGDWVSDADTSSEQAVRESLEGAAPGLEFFGEEAGGRRGDGPGWLVDPLDGTANFLHRFPVVGVSVALVLDGRPIVGVVHAPLLGETYTAIRGGGASCNGEPVHVASRPPASAICATGFPFRSAEVRPRYLAMLAAALAEFEDLRRAGAASLDLAWTAAGIFDGYFELALGPWDVAAGALLVEEAGGLVSDWTDDPDAWLDSGDILVGSPGVHERLLALAAATDDMR